MKLTRRELAGTLVSAAVAAAQTEPPAPTSEQQLSAARERIRDGVKALDATDLPMSTEPAFRFTA